MTDSIKEVGFLTEQQLHNFFAFSSQINVQLFFDLKNVHFCGLVEFVLLLTFSNCNFEYLDFRTIFFFACSHLPKCRWCRLQRLTFESQKKSNIWVNKSSRRRNFGSSCISYVWHMSTKRQKNRHHILYCPFTSKNEPIII